MSFPFGGGSAFQRVNLADRPFSNSRPRRRLSVVLWSLAVIATLWNLFLFAQYWRGSSNGREDLRAVRAQIDERIASIRSLQDELGSANLGTQNEHVRFLNRKIAERTFPWSRLFDDLATVLPLNVRLRSLAPSIPESKSRRGQEVDGPLDWILLSLDGTAKTSEEVLTLVDGMFASDTFASPVLTNERDSDGEIEFDLSVRYRINPLLLTDSDQAETPVQLTDAETGEAADAAGSDLGGLDEGTTREPSASTSGAPTNSAPAQSATSVGAPRAAVAVTEPEPTPQPAATRESTPAVSAPRVVAPTPRRPAEQVEAPDRTPLQRTPSSQNGRNEAGAASRTVGVPRRPTPQPTATSNPTQAQTPQAGQDPRRGQRAESGRRVISADDLPPDTREAADERFGRDQDVAPRVDNASQGGGR